MKDEFIKIVSSLHSYLLGIDAYDILYYDENISSLSNNVNNTCFKKVDDSNKIIDPWEEIREEALKCMKCRLYSTRHSVVFGEGDRNSILLIVGEAPGYEEDMQGKPFVGEAGKLLTKMLDAINIKRSEVFITNVLKCRPPSNRDPKPDEIHSCSYILNSQMKIMKPKIILTLGRYSSSFVLKTNKGITEIRGKFYELKDYIVVPTFHPAALLRNQSLKKLAWIDLQILRDILKNQGFYK